MRTKLIMLRKSKHISVKEMAEKLKVSKSFYYKIEKGYRNPSLILAKKITDILGGTIESTFLQKSNNISGENEYISRTIKR